MASLQKAKLSAVLWAVWVNVCRLLLAATFVFSGFVKALDPSGNALKIKEYGMAWGLHEQTDGFYFLLLGFGIMLETVRLYFLPGVVTPEGVDRGKLTTGWGMYNNIGCIIAMCIPASFYFASTRKNGWQYTLLGCLTLAGVVLTQSRGSILFGGIVFLASYAYVIVRSRGRERLCHLIVAGALILLAMIAVAVFFEKFMQLFSSMLRFDSNGRDGIWESGLKQFAGHPLFGVGFYECEAFRWGQLPSDSFLPPRYHNTYLQLMASGGVVALLAYAFHRFQTVRLLWRRRTRENIFLAFIVLALILTSTVDCHFFNFGPGLLYSVILVFLERGSPEEKRESAAESAEGAEGAASEGE